MHIADVTKGMLGANAHRRRRPAARGRRGDRLPQSRQRPRQHRLRRRRQLQPGHRVRGDEHGRRAEGAGDLRDREQRLQRAHRARTTPSARRTSPAAHAASACRPSAATARISSRCTKRQAALIANARRGEGPSTLEATITRFYGHFEGDPQLYRAKDEVKRQRETMDCLKNFRARVTAEGWLAGCRARRDRRARCWHDRSRPPWRRRKSSPPPAESELETDVYISY